MPTANLKLPANIDVHTFANQISNLVGRTLSASDFKRKEVDGGVFYSYNKNNYVIAAYNHPTKIHTAHAYEFKFILVKNGPISSAAPGKWAISWLQKKSYLLGGTSYGTK